MPRASSRISLQRVRELFAGAGHVAVVGLAARGQAQLERQGHEPLLRAVVQVALDPPALLVARLHDAGARGAQILARLRIREGLCRKFGEVRDPLLGILGEPLLIDAEENHRPPQASAEEDRRRHR